MSILVLGFFDNNAEDNLPCLEHEQKELRSILRNYSNDELVYYDEYNGGGDGLLNAILNHQNEVDWIHFSGHHTTDGRLMLFDKTFAEIGEVLLACPNLKGVFINGCSSYESLKPVMDDVPITIGTKSAVYDHFACYLSTLYYKSIGLDDWHDYERMRLKFGSALALAKNSMEQINELQCYRDSQGENGRGLEIPETSTDVFFINDESDELRERFNQRTPNVYRYQINNDKGIEDYIEDKLGFTHYETYVGSLPCFLRPILEQLASARHESNKIGLSRVFKIIELFDAYFNFCRYTILSTLWDEIGNDKVDFKKCNSLSLLQGPSVFTPEDMDCLESLCSQIIKVHGSDSERQVIGGIRDTMHFLKNTIHFVNANRRVKDPEDRVLWEAEVLLHSMVSKFQFLLKYKIRSVFTRFYEKYRNEPKERYYVQGRKFDAGGDDKPIIVEDVLGFECLNIHSIYLYKEDDKQEPVINLSPFYFDKNSGDSKAIKIDLSVLQFYSEADGAFHFSSVSYDHELAKDGPSNFSIKENNDQPQVNEFKFNQRKIYNQLMFFIKALKNG